MDYGQCLFECIAQTTSTSVQLKSRTAAVHPQTPHSHAPKNSLHSKSIPPLAYSILSHWGLSRLREWFHLFLFILTYVVCVRTNSWTTKKPLLITKLQQIAIQMLLFLSR